MPGIFSVRGFDETWAGKNHQRSTSIIQYTHICMCIYIYAHYTRSVFAIKYRRGPLANGGWCQLAPK